MADAEKKITVKHINVRQSISFLVLKILLLEIVFAIIIFNLAFPHPSLDAFFSMFSAFLPLRVYMFWLAVIFKFYFSFLIVYQWLNEYYEISPTKIVHRKGFIFRKEEAYEFRYIKLAGVKQGFFGRLLNYGTIHLYDLYINKNIYFYLVHNPMKYFRLIEELMPTRADEEREILDLRTRAEDFE